MKSSKFRPDSLVDMAGTSSFVSPGQPTSSASSFKVYASIAGFCLDSKLNSSLFVCKVSFEKMREYMSWKACRSMPYLPFSLITVFSLAVSPSSPERQPKVLKL